MCHRYAKNVLNELHLPTLQERRTDKRLSFLYNILQKDKVPSIHPHEYLTPIKPRKHIKAKSYSDCETQNIIKSFPLSRTEENLVSCKDASARYTHSLTVAGAVYSVHSTTAVQPPPTFGLAKPHLQMVI